MLASVTRLRVRSALLLPSFLWQTFLARRQIIGAPGFIGGRLLVDARRTHWTLSVWEDERAMKAYRGSRPHGQVMPRLIEWCDEAAYAHWSSMDEQIPSWQTATSA